MVTFQEDTKAPSNKITTTTFQSRVRASFLHGRQSISGFMFGRQPMSFDDQVDSCKCAPSGKAMAHARKSELLDLQDLDISQSSIDDNSGRCYNSDQAKAQPLKEPVNSFFGFQWPTESDESQARDNETSVNNSQPQDNSSSLGLMDQVGTFWTALLGGEGNQDEEEKEDEETQ